MGVNIFILDRRSINLAVAGIVQKVGSLHRFWKVTELNAERAKELRALEVAASLIPSPKAAMVAESEEFRLESALGPKVRAHLVIGWDIGRTSVTDMGWDYLPVLGYAIRTQSAATFVLHEEQNGVLSALGRERADEIGLVGSDGQLLRLGQPTISECAAVQSYIPGYAEADCTFDNGRKEKLLVSIDNSKMPSPSWLIGKRPLQVKQYPPVFPPSRA